MESAEDATGGATQRQGGISAPGLRLLQAIAGVHLTNAQTGSPGIQALTAAGYRGTWVLPLLPYTVVPPSSIRSLPTPYVLDSAVQYSVPASLSTLRLLSQGRKIDPPKPLRLSLSKPTSMPCQHRRRSTARRQRQLQKEAALLQALT